MDAISVIRLVWAERRLPWGTRIRSRQVKLGIAQLQTSRWSMALPDRNEPAMEIAEGLEAIAARQDPEERSRDRSGT